jgi:undecaprenyl diphosphate synthase
MSTEKTAVRHLAIIMDGNRRWAKERGLSSLEGHRQGYETFKKIGDAALARGVEVMTVYAFSTENWKRTEEEVGFLMDLLEFALSAELSSFKEKNIRLKIVGRREGLRPSVLRAIETAEGETSENTGGTLCLCINYGGRTEIVDAVKKLVKDGVAVEQIDEQAIASRLYWSNMPDPDLIIRTSGEQRMSNFLMWESVYSELYWCKKYWPDFSEKDLDEALEEYASRQRRYGK